MNAKLDKMIAAISLAASMLIPAGASASDYPSRAIQFVVPFAAGGWTDGYSRALARALGDHLKQPVVVENRPGAGGGIGAAQVARSAPDGYTLVLATNGPFAANKYIYENQSYDAIKDFDPVILLGKVPYVLAINKNMLPVKSVEELIQTLRSKPNQYSYGSGGTGTASHFAGELFRTMADLKIEHVSYKGESPAFTDLLGGHIPYLFGSYMTVGPHVNDERVEVLAVTSSQRLNILPNIPTLDEAGMKGYDISPWFGVVAPAGTPKEVIRKLNAAILEVQNQPDMIQRMEAIGGIMVNSSPDAFSEFIKSEDPKWAELVKISGAKN